MTSTTLRFETIPAIFIQHLSFIEEKSKVRSVLFYHRRYKHVIIKVSGVLGRVTNIFSTLHKRAAEMNYRIEDYLKRRGLIR
ncbi:hypothetical protein VN24_09815 [Paenibacillus beijingensis]|uniref:Uncharacterized protein n=1 Tax=Paenibacillus beijingensis TaxID=1126833 RepID=A0A0D5NI88_9BACL|nr:hypothetical protein VN24_09815 [Paenibacillus beijingensis]